MKPLCLLSLIAVMTASAVAQQPSNPYEFSIWQTYGKLRADSPFRLDISGTETIGRVTRSFSANLCWHMGVDSRSGAKSNAYVELDEFDTTGTQPLLVRRLVGDGQTLWDYEIASRRYSATFYSYYGKTPPPDYAGTDAPKLLTQLYALTEGAPSYMVRLMRELNPGSDLLVTGGSTPTFNSTGSNARYQSWSPGYTPAEPPTLPPTPDPLVPSRLYSSGGNVQIILYGPYGPYPNPNRSVAFQLNNGGTANDPDWRLNTIFFAERSSNRFIQWTMNVTDPAIPDPFTFHPYSASVIQGWQPLAPPKPYGG